MDVLLSNPRDFTWAGAPGSSILAPTIAATLYLLVVLVLDAKLLPAIDTKRAQGVHNAILCGWSAIMFVGGMAAATHRISSDGFTWVVCEAESTTSTGPLFYWAYMYYISKYYELLDTVLQLLKGRRPPFFSLHVFHHSGVLFMAWWWLEYRQTLHTVGLVFNTFVHIPMYRYYALRVQGKQPWWKKHITQLQIVQFTTSAVCFLFTLYQHVVLGNSCQGFGVMLLNLAFNMTLLSQFVGVLRHNTKHKRQ